MARPVVRAEGFICVTVRSSETTVGDTVRSSQTAGRVIVLVTAVRAGEATVRASQTAVRALVLVVTAVCAGETSVRVIVRSIAASADRQTASSRDRASVLLTFVRSTNEAAGLPSAVCRAIAVVVVSGIAAEAVVPRVRIDPGV